MVEASPFVTELLTQDKFAHYWPAISKELDTIKHMWEMWWTKEFIYDATSEGRFQCWAIHENEKIIGILFTQIAPFPARRILEGVLMFGDGAARAVDSIDATISKFARAWNCSAIAVHGRSGWEKKISHLGFKRTNVLLTKYLQPERMN